MRTNPDEAKKGSYAITFNSAPTGTANCDTAQCTPAETITFDRNLWKCSLGNWNTENVCKTLGVTGYLPDGDGAITRNTTNTAIHTVQIRWRDRDNTITTFEVSTVL